MSLKAYNYIIKEIIRLLKKESTVAGLVKLFQGKYIGIVEVFG
jgi:hypothetical protein